MRRGRQSGGLPRFHARRAECQRFFAVLDADVLRAVVDRIAGRLAFALAGLRFVVVVAMLVLSVAAGKSPAGGENHG